MSAVEVTGKNNACDRPSRMPPRCLGDGWRRRPFTPPGKVRQSIGWCDAERSIGKMSAYPTQRRHKGRQVELAGHRERTELLQVLGLAVRRGAATAHATTRARHTQSADNHGSRTSAGEPAEWAGVGSGGMTPSRPNKRSRGNKQLTQLADTHRKRQLAHHQVVQNDTHAPDVRRFTVVVTFLW